MDRSLSEFRGQTAATLAAALCLACGNSHIYALGSLVGPLHDAFGWSRGAVTASMFLGALTSAAAAPFIGIWMDRKGAFPVALVCLPYYFVLLAALSLNPGSLTGWYVVWGLICLVQMPMASGLWATAIARRFHHARGKALAIVLAGAAIMSGAGPVILAVVGEHFGWRAAIVALATLGFLTAAAAAPLALRPKPAPAADIAVSPVTPPGGIGLGEAVRRLEFWLFCLALFVVGGTVILLIVHLQPMLIDMGFSRTQAAASAAIAAPALLTGRLLIGACFDRFPTMYVVAGCFALPLLAALSAANLQHVPYPGVILPILAGFCVGIEADMIAYLTAKYMGTRHFGSLYAVITSVYGVGSGFMTMLSGIIFDVAGSYTVLMYAMAAALLGAYVCAAQLPNISNAKTRPQLKEALDDQRA